MVEGENPFLKVLPPGQNKEVSEQRERVGLPNPFEIFLQEYPEFQDATPNETALANELLNLIEDAISSMEKISDCKLEDKKEEREYNCWVLKTDLERIERWLSLLEKGQNPKLATFIVYRKAEFDRIKREAEYLTKDEKKYSIINNGFKIEES